MKRPAHVPHQLMVKVRHLSTSDISPHASIQEVIRLLSENDDASARIAADTISALNEGRKVFLLTK